MRHSESVRPTTHTFRSWDDAELFYLAWIPPTPATKTVLLFHRGHEHSGSWLDTVESLALEDCAVFAWDQRGHGQSDGERGHAENLAAIVKDADAFSRHLCQNHNVDLQNTVIVAHSVGAVIATAWIHDYAPPVRGLVLATPAFSVKLYIPLAIPFLRLRQKLLGRGTVKSYVKASMLTHDAAKAAAYELDPLIFRQIAINILLDLHDISKRLLADAGAIRVPTLIVSAGKDWIVHLRAQTTFYQRLGSTVKQLEFYENLRHSIFAEIERSNVVDRVRLFINECFHSTSTDSELLAADRGGFTRSEYDLLRLPRRARWSFARGLLRTFGKLSTGIALGLRSGFDSGLTLDYVYRNRPEGSAFLGKLIDYFYLNSVGWRGIRIRREHLQKALQDCICSHNDAARPIRILDIAAGAGRYVLEVIQKNDPPPESVLLCDNYQPNLDAAKELARSLGINAPDTRLADAFDRDTIASISPRPNIAIASGLYELFPDNEPIRQSLAGLAATMEDGGYLIYTCQPWHPQIEFIAKVLDNRVGKPWIMRRRTQAEMDALVRSARFEKISQQIDCEGIFTVSIARLLKTPTAT